MADNTSFGGAASASYGGAAAAASEHDVQAVVFLFRMHYPEPQVRRCIDRHGGNVFNAMRELLPPPLDCIAALQQQPPLVRQVGVLGFWVCVFVCVCVSLSL